MKLEELRHKLRQDPEYADAERELEAFLQLGDEILRLRLERGWSQSELARRMGTGQTNISRIESGLANPTLGTIHKFAQAFGVDLLITLGNQEHDKETDDEGAAAAAAGSPQGVRRYVETWPSAPHASEIDSEPKGRREFALQITPPPDPPPAG